MGKKLPTGRVWSLLALADMHKEPKAIFSRDVDLVEKAALRNPFRRRSIWDNAEMVYTA